MCVAGCPLRPPAKPAKKLPLMYLCNDILLEKNSPQQLKEALKKSLVVALKDGFG